MNVDIQFDGTELSKSAKYALIISDLEFDELRSLLIKLDVNIDGKIILFIPVLISVKFKQVDYLLINQTNKMFHQK